jgi:hypothetical protein
MSILAATLLMLTSGASNAQVPADRAPPPVTPAKTERAEASHDPIICERSTEIGSRLKRRKVCMHRSEWDRQRLEDKQMIDRTQVLRGVTPAG